MKKQIVICLILLSNFVNGQILTKYIDNTQSNKHGFAYTVKIRLTLLRMALFSFSKE